MKKYLLPLILVALVAAGCNKEPEACFFFSGEDLTVLFTADCSVNADTYRWDFGDGTTSVGASITHVFPQFGTYTVTLAVETKKGKSSTTSTPITLTPAPNLIFDGIYALNENCDGGVGTYSVVIAPDMTSRNQATFNGLHGNGTGVTAVIGASGTSFTIARQAIGATFELECSNGSINADGTQINMTYLLYNLTSGNLEETCTAVLTR